MRRREFITIIGGAATWPLAARAPARTIVFTSDTGPFPGLVQFAQGADLLIAEANSIEQRMQDLTRSGQWQVMTTDEQTRIKQQMAEGHLSPEDVGKLSEGAAVKAVVLSHLTWKADDEYSGWAEEVKRWFAGPVLIAKDLNEFNRPRLENWDEVKVRPCPAGDCYRMKTDAGFHLPRAPSLQN